MENRVFLSVKSNKEVLKVGNWPQFTHIEVVWD